MEMSINEMPKRILLGLKINVATLTEKKVTIEDVRKSLYIEEYYVVGLDTFNVEEPHYHIHFQHKGTFSAKTQLRNRKLKGYGMSTKLYQARDIDGSDPYCWYGYAVKEKIISISPEVDEIPLKIHAATQLEVRKLKWNHTKKIEVKKTEKVSFEESLFDELVERKLKGAQPLRFSEYATLISRIAYDLHKRILLPNRVEYYTWKYLLTHNITTHSIYVREKLKDYDIEFYTH
jgi:hypothetical protein